MSGFATTATVRLRSTDVNFTDEIFLNVED